MPATPETPFVGQMVKLTVAEESAVDDETISFWWGAHFSGKSIFRMLCVMLDSFEGGNQSAF